MSPSLYLSKKYYYLLEELELGMGHWTLGMGIYNKSDTPRLGHIAQDNGMTETE